MSDSPDAASNGLRFTEPIDEDLAAILKDKSDVRDRFIDLWPETAKQFQISQDSPPTIPTRFSFEDKGRGYEVFEPPPLAGTSEAVDSDRWSTIAGFRGVTGRDPLASPMSFAQPDGATRESIAATDGAAHADRWSTTAVSGGVMGRDPLASLASTRTESATSRLKSFTGGLLDRVKSASLGWFKKNPRAAKTVDGALKWMGKNPKTTMVVSAALAASLGMLASPPVALVGIAVGAIAGKIASSAAEKVNLLDRIGVAANPGQQGGNTTQNPARAEQKSVPIHEPTAAQQRHVVPPARSFSAAASLGQDRTNSASNSSSSVAPSKPVTPAPHVGAQSHGQAASGPVHIRR